LLVFKLIGTTLPPNHTPKNKAGFKTGFPLNPCKNQSAKLTYHHSPCLRGVVDGVAIVNVDSTIVRSCRLALLD